MFDQRWMWAGTERPPFPSSWVRARLAYTDLTEADRLVRFSLAGARRMLEKSADAARAARYRNIRRDQDAPSDR
ncbi:hypothetical protein JQ544_30155 [Bradyrhizobium diazoefficiens]|nr:hypothetical protein [Bradyrhizobium diazoefficiens]MBR0815829.1 hypothetical protein [Bradyrhizobium diazoefficiens]